MRSQLIISNTLIVRNTARLHLDLHIFIVIPIFCNSQGDEIPLGGEHTYQESGQPTPPTAGSRIYGSMVTGNGPNHST